MRGGIGEIFKRLKKRMIFCFYLHAFSKHTHTKKKQALDVQL